MVVLRFRQPIIARKHCRPAIRREFLICDTGSATDAAAAAAVPSANSSPEAAAKDAVVCRAPSA